MALTEEQQRCRDIILSQDYGDFVVSYGGDIEVMAEIYNPSCYEKIDNNFVVIQRTLPESGQLNPDEYSYNLIPDLLGLLDTTSMEQSGILPVHYSPASGFRGSGIIVGVIDTGIDYTHPAFRFSDGNTRILSIWDQTIQTDQVPERFPFGTVYTRDDINAALQAEEPLDVVPSRDENGHGTFIAGIMAGTEDQANGFIGAAPEASIVAVKLKPAKQYLRDYYVIKEDAIAFQETDIMMAIEFLRSQSVRYQMPLVVCLGLGNTLDSHEGSSTLSQYLNVVNNITGICVVAAAGNELGKAHHYAGVVEGRDEFDTVELRVGEGEQGFQMEIWGSLSDVFSVEIISPEGERIARSQSRIGDSQRVNLFLEGTEIYLANRSAGLSGGQFLMVLQFRSPTPGIWTLRVYGDRILRGRFDIWLPMEKFIQDSTYFLNPDPDITLTSVATTNSIVVTSNYNHYNDRLYVNSSRGYTSSGVIKPDIAAPGVNVYGPEPGGRYGVRSGSSISAAHGAGAAALLMEWGLLRAIITNMDGNDIRRLLIQGAVQKGVDTYPNPGWGYGAMNLKNTFETLRIVR
ncbi:MAG: peptidase [Clostridia bacterium]|nr:peptidase [Clostridia bacterium]